MRNKVTKQLRKLVGDVSSKGYDTINKHTIMVTKNGGDFPAAQGTLVLKESGRTLYKQIKRNYAKIRKESGQ